ncbi:MAG TPA: FHA domain-containing protein [Clostridiaceae bacterium]|nr:FHA domain-containing protein [Clostridiaceae bacterium]
MTLESLRKLNINRVGKVGSDLTFEFSKINSGMGLLDYQIEMLAENPQDYIVPMDVRKFDSTLLFSFTVSALNPLSDFLRKINDANMFWNVIYSLVCSLWDSKKLLLYERSFVLDEEFIYVDRNNNVRLLYFPLSTEDSFKKELKSLLLRLLSRVTHIIPEGDEYFKNLTALAKSDHFSLDDLLALFRNFRFRQVEKEPDKVYETVVNEQNSSKTGKKDTGSSGLKKIILPALVCQGMVAIIALIADKYMKSAGLALIERYILITIFIIFVDYGLYKYYLKVKNSEKKEASGEINLTGSLDNHFEGKDSKIYVSPPQIDSKKLTGTQAQSFPVHDTPVYQVNNEPEMHMEETSLLDGGNQAFAWLVGENGKFELAGDNIMIGRSIDLADIVIPAKFIGRIHAKIIYRDGEYYLSDENSKNGTFINNAKIEPKNEYRLKNGDIVTFANMEYTFIK